MVSQLHMPGAPHNLRFIQYTTQRHSRKHKSSFFLRQRKTFYQTYTKSFDCFEANVYIISN